MSLSAPTVEANEEKRLHNAATGEFAICILKRASLCRTLLELKFVVLMLRLESLKASQSYSDAPVFHPQV